MGVNFIKEIIAEYVGYEESDEVGSDLSITDDLNLDDDTLTNIISEIEDEYGIEIPEEEIEAFEFVLDIESYVSQNI
ncbi:phosphopantetheine-binding protein [Fusibacter sp. JL216-2]|uniref:phosphopantetheine-binding protein n=1 Tax=Fusibacter sp. JL216-2 TaxID=3071453 RepID=UPI003D350F8B